MPQNRKSENDMPQNDMPQNSSPMNLAAGEPSQVPRGAAGVFSRVRQAIINGDYPHHQRLPSERDLALQFSAARGTVRAALVQLEQANLVRRKFGSGTFVAYDNPFAQTDIAEDISPLDLMETRLALEPHMVNLVITNASHRDLGKLQEALARVVASKTDPDTFSAADESFHLMLAHCSQNRLLIWIYQRINAIRTHSQWSERKNDILSAEKIMQYNRQHIELMRLIVRRDRDGAVRTMIAHLNQAKKDLLGSS